MIKQVRPKLSLLLDLFGQLAQLLAEALGLFLVIMHDGILKQGVKSLDRLNRVVPLRHRPSLYSTTSTPPMGSVPLSSGEDWLHAV